MNRHLGADIPEYEKNPEVGVISVHGLVIKGCIEWKSKARMAICRNYEWSGKRQGARLRPFNTEVNIFQTCVHSSSKLVLH